MVTKIIHVADIHIRNLRRMDEYEVQLQEFIDRCKEIVDKNGAEQTRIVIAGDIVHNKLDISGEGYILSSWFLKQLDSIAKTIVIAGNHDVNVTNLSRLDPLSAIFSMCNFKQTVYLDKEFGYQSGCLIDDNIVWCLYSTFDDFARPDIDSIKISEGSDNFTYVALFHGVVKNAKTDTGFSFSNGYAGSHFEGVDFGLLGHVHKRQCIKYDGIPLVYPGSLIQQDQGENVSNHGFLIWDVENASYEEVNLPNEDYGFYTFCLNSMDDLDDDKETILNL